MMTVSFACPECAKRYAVDQALAGKRAKCKQCGHLMTVPASARGPRPEAPGGGATPPGFDPYALDDEPAAMRASGVCGATADAGRGYGLAEPVASRAGAAVAEAPAALPRRVGASRKKAAKSRGSSGVLAGRGGAGLSLGGVVAVAVFVLRLVVIGQNGFGIGLSGRSEVEQYAETNLAGLKELTTILGTVNDQATAAAATPRAVTVMNRLLAEARRVQAKKARISDLDAVRRKYEGQIDAASASLDLQMKRVATVPGGMGVLTAIQGPAHELAVLEAANGGGAPRM